MKKLMSLAIVAIIVASTTAAMAGERYQFRPTVLTGGPTLYSSSINFAQATPPAPAGHAATPDPVGGGVVTLFPCVKIEDPDHIAPCAVPKIVQVKDPCDRCCDPCSCCQPKCVSVKICVPPCGCPKITCKKDGSYVKYDYGKYRIEIRSRKGVVTVDYDD